MRMFLSGGLMFFGDGRGEIVFMLKIGNNGVMLVLRLSSWLREYKAFIYKILCNYLGLLVLWYFGFMVGAKSMDRVPSSY